MYGHDGLSKAVRGFLVVNGPNSVAVDQEFIRWIVQEKKLDSIAQYSPFSPQVSWMRKFSDDGSKVIFSPYYVTSGESRQIKQLEEAILQELKLVPIEIVLPEKVVTMPIPGWTWANDADGNGFVVSAYTTTMFLFEACAVRDEFFKKLDEVLS